jgi:hypothetical protein
MGLHMLIAFTYLPGFVTIVFHGMPVTGGRGFKGLKPLWDNGVPP